MLVLLAGQEDMIPVFLGQTLRNLLESSFRCRPYTKQRLGGIFIKNEAEVWPSSWPPGSILDEQFFVSWVLLLMSTFSKWLGLVHRAPSKTSRVSPKDIPDLLQTIAAQDCIGWLGFFQGCIAAKWTRVHPAHSLWLG